MKYGEHLKNNIAPEYGPEPYLAYERLDQIITELMQTKPSRYVGISIRIQWTRLIFSLNLLNMYYYSVFDIL